MKTIPIRGEVREEVRSVLAESTWFQVLEGRAKADDEGAKRLERLIGLADLVEFPAGATIIEESFPSDSFLIVVRGQVDVRVARSGGRASVGHLRRPASFGEVGLLLGEPRSATVVAESDTLVLRFTAVAFQELFHALPEFGLETARHLARRLREVSARVPLPESDIQRPVPDEADTAEGVPPVLPPEPTGPRPGEGEALLPIE